MNGSRLPTSNSKRLVTRNNLVKKKLKLDIQKQTYGMLMYDVCVVATATISGDLMLLDTVIINDSRLFFVTSRKSASPGSS